MRPNSIESTVSASNVGNTRAGAIGRPAEASSASVKPKVKLLPPGLNPLANDRYAIVESDISISPVIFPVVSSEVPFSANVSVLKKFITFVLNVSSEYLMPATRRKSSLTLYVPCP